MRPNCTIAVLSLLALAVLEAKAQPRSPEGELRRAMFGAQLAEVISDVRERQRSQKTAESHSSRFSQARLPRTPNSKPVMCCWQLTGRLTGIPCSSTG